MKNQIPPSPLESSNEQNISKLDDFSFNTGTQPGQYESSLYGTLTELCKEKKNVFLQTNPLSGLPSSKTHRSKGMVHLLFCQGSCYIQDEKIQDQSQPNQISEGKKSCCKDSHGKTHRTACTWLESHS